MYHTTLMNRLFYICIVLAVPAAQAADGHKDHVHAAISAVPHAHETQPQYRGAVVTNKDVTYELVAAATQLKSGDA